MNNIIYDRSFNANEWFVIGMMVIGGIAIILLPKMMSPAETTFNMLIGVSFGLMFDHTIGVPPFDFYDVGDQAQYNLFDIVSYAMYIPASYFFIYFYLRFKIQNYKTIFYIILWTALGILLEWIGVKMGVFHYKHGYRIMYSIPIYLALESLHLGLYLKYFYPFSFKAKRRPAIE